MKIMRSLILAGLLVGALGACGDQGEVTVTTAGTGKAPTITTTGPDDSWTPSPVANQPDLTCGSNGNWESVPALENLTVKEATEQAKQDGFKVRILGADGECYGATDDLNYKRINIYSEDGRVVWAQVY
jgi:hypothetical protein